MRRTTIGTLLAVGLLAGCGGPATGHHTARPAPSAAASATRPGPPKKTSDTFGCLTPAQAATGSYALPTENGSLDAYLTDPGADPAHTVVVLAHQAGGSLCDWLPHLDAFGKAGYGTLAFDSGGDRDEIATVVRALAGRGATGVVLVGASKGGTASLVAAAGPLALPVRAVVALSAPAHYQQDDARAAVGTTGLPEFFAAEADDSPFSDDATTLHDSAASTDTQLKLYPGHRHGALLLDDGALPDVLAFLAKYAPPSP
jgi:dienelactone hydrolase